ncbi:hypothetical protein HEP87_63035 [Streptomyces sp. S1D4-11]
MKTAAAFDFAVGGPRDDPLAISATKLRYGSGRTTPVLGFARRDDHRSRRRFGEQLGLAEPVTGSEHHHHPLGALAGNIGQVLRDHGRIACHDGGTDLVSRDA